MFEQRAKLGGYLVGYGVIKKDGSKVEKWLKKPIHNTITKNMLNGLLQFNGDNTLSSVMNDAYFLWMKGTPSQTSTRTGVMNFGAYGDGTGETSVNDNALKNKTSEYSSNHIQGTWYTNTHAVNNDPDNAIYHRVAYQFAAVDTAQDVKEFGVFHRIEPAVEYRMTARVQLESTLHLEVGDAPFFIYELKVCYTDVTLPVQMAGIGKWIKKINYVGGSQNPSITGYSVSNSPSCGIQNYSLTSYIAGQSRLPAYSIGTYGAVAGRTCLTPYKTSFTPVDGKTNTVHDMSSTVSQNAGFARAATVSDYVIDSFYRDSLIVMPETWASDSDIYGIMFNGDQYQFGDMVDGVFTPSPWHKDYGKELIINARQSYSTDLLTPAG